MMTRFDERSPAGLAASAAAAQPGRAVVCLIWHDQACGDQSELAGSIHANAYACINLVLRGRVRLASSPDWLPRSFVTGPMTKPLRTVHTVPLHSLSIVVQAWLLPAWLGIAPRMMVDQVFDLSTLARGAAWLERIAPILSTADDQAGLMDRIAATLPEIDGTAERYSSLVWAAGRVAPAAEAAGMSERHFHREFVRRFGLGPKQWLQLRRFEHTLVHLARSEQAGNSLVETALSTGFTDQPHMNRSFRACAATTPHAAQALLRRDAPGFTSLRAARLFSTDQLPGRP